MPQGKLEELEMMMAKLTPKQRGKISIAYFAYYYHGFIVPEHQCNWFDRILDHNRVLLLSPRDHGKTHSIARIYAEWCTLYYPDTRILLFSKSHTQSVKSLEVIAQDLQSNTRILHDFEYELRKFHKRENMVFYNHETVQRDATIEASGFLGAVTGSHFDIIICDDLIDDENTRTPQQMEKADGWFKGTVLGLAEPDTKVIVIGTRKHHNDLYGGLIENPRWRVIKDQAIQEFPDKYEFVENDDGEIVDVIVDGKCKVLWPEKWGIKELLLQRQDMGSIYFDREYQNDPSGLQGQMLNAEWLKYYGKDEVWKSDGTFKIPLTVYQSWDLGISDDPSSDFTVCITLGVTRDKKIYVLDIFHDQISFPDQVKKVIELGDLWKPLQIGIESNAYQLALPQMVGTKSLLPIKPVTSGTGVSKEQKIIANSVYYENGKVYLPDWHYKVDELEREYKQFPKGQHDDIIDAMSMGFILARENMGSGDPFMVVPGGRKW